MKITHTTPLRLAAAVLSVLLAACGDGASDHRTLEEKYAVALDDARTAEKDELHDDLIAIVPSNTDLIWDAHEPKRLLVSTLTAWSGYQPYVGSEIKLAREVWVTVVPEVQEFCQRHLEEGDDVALRLEQLLGLNNRARSLMVELYADPADMFRPTPDPEINDHTADLDFPPGVSAEHVIWFNTFRDTAYGPNGYPWTRLGYTCDWIDGECRVGPSEFVVRSGSTVYVQAVHAVADYCRERSK